jgi:hypothetical protein
MTTITRDVTLTFYRSCPVNECTIERSNTAHLYKITQSSITRLWHLVQRNRIELEVEFYLFTEIKFSCDKEVDDPEDE